MANDPYQRRPLRTLTLLLAGALVLSAEAPAPEPREDPCFRIGEMPSGPLDAITDVAGVKVGQVTIERGTQIHTGVTAILPHGGNLFRERVPAGFFVANGFGKFAGSTQVEELGEIETPIVLTNTLSVAEGIAGSVEWTLAQPGNEDVRSVNAVVGETNDGVLNDIRGRHVSVADVRHAIESAISGPVAEGAVGAGTGTTAFGWKAGIGTASRMSRNAQGNWTVGVLVQANYGGQLTIAGKRIALQPSDLKPQGALREKRADGSVVIVIATDAPISDRNLRRLAERAFAGIARTGSAFSNGSGDYAIAFSTAPGVRRDSGKDGGAELLGNQEMNPLFQAVADATEQSVVHALLAAKRVEGFHDVAEPLPKAKLRAVMGCG